MSAFDDEFGLFGDEASSSDDEERKPTLGARKIATSETIIDEIEPEEDAPPRRRTGPRGAGAPPSRRFVANGPGDGERRPRARVPRPPIAPEVGLARAKDLLVFLAKGLVSKPDAIVVEAHPDNRGAVLELEVDPEDLGKVIGRGGRVAQALRTLVRAGAEGRVTVDILDVDDDEDEDAGEEVVAVGTIVVAESEIEDDAILDAEDGEFEDGDFEDDEDDEDAEEE